MKNVHILPTELASRLAYYQESTSYNKPILQLVNTTSSDYSYQNIYITSDEKIKEGDYFIALDGSNDIYKANKVWLDIIKENPNPSQKIILTTDQNLIEDDVQAIDDEFLEWFVKNPSCESVEVEKVSVMNDRFILNYEIIIPKEEPNQDTMSEAIKQVIDNQLKQETLEEETLTKIKFVLSCGNDSQAIRLLEQYGDWKQKRSYSEEEVIFNAAEESFKDFRKDILEPNRFDFISGFTACAKWQQEQDAKVIQDLKARLDIANESSTKALKMIEELEKK